MDFAMRRLFVLTAISILVLSAGCRQPNPAGLEVARAPIDPLVFDDDYSEDVYFQAFFQTHLRAVELDSVYAYNGSAPDGARSLKINVSPLGSALGIYVEDYVVAGENTKMYSALNFVGILFENQMVDASAMTYFHLDVFAPTGTDFKVKLVSFPPELTAGVQTTDLILDAGSAPAFNSGSWSSLEIPLADFELPESWDWGHVGQLVLSTSTAQLVLVDNV